MADLLECLLQISALRETVGRVRRLSTAAGTSAARDDVRRGVTALLEAEARWQAFLRTTLPATMSATLVWPSPGTAEVGDVCEAFERARLSTQAVLDACSAADLAAVGPIAGRPRATVADLVAMMLANDTQTVGELSRAVGMPAPASAPRCDAG